MYNEWNICVPSCFDVTLEGVAASSGERPLSQEKLDRGTETDTTRLSSSNILHFHPPPMVRNGENALVRRGTSLGRYHVKSMESIQTVGGVAYMECQIASIDEGERPDGDLLGYVPPPLVIGAGCRGISPLRLPGQDLHSVGYFTSQRMVFSHGSGEGERLHLPLLGEPPLTADGTLRTCAGQGSSVPRSGLQVGDCVGCIVNSLNNCVHFTLNGYLLPFFRSLGSKEAPNEIHFEIGVQRRTPAFSVRVHMVAGVVNRPGPLPTLAFDVDAYSRAVGAAYMMTIHGVKSTPTEYGSLYGEMADDYHLLRRYLLQRGMAETLRHLDSELEELRGAKVGENLEKGASDHLQYALQIAELRRSAIGDEDHSGATTLSKLSGASVLSPEVRRGVARRLPRADPAGLSRMTADGRWNVVWLYQRADLLYLLKGEAFLRRWVGRLEGYLKGEGETLGGRDDWALRVLEEFGTDLLQPLSQIDRSALPGDVDGGDFVHVARQMEEANATEAEMPEETVMAILQSLVIVATPFRGAPSVATQLTLGQTLAAVVGEVACSPPHAAAALLSLLSTVKERVRVGVWRYTVRSLESLNERLLHLVSLECPKWGALSRNEPTPLTLRSTLRRVYGGAAVVPAVHNTTGLLDQQLGRSVDRLVPPSTARRVKGGDVEETDTMESVRVAKTHFETVCHCLVPL